MKKFRPFLSSIISVLAPALQIQGVVFLGLLLTLGVSLFYRYMGDPRYPAESFSVILWPTIVSLGCFLLGLFVARLPGFKKDLNLAQGAWVVFMVWLISCSISGLLFVLAGFPVPTDVESFSLLRRFVDGFYESMSGFTTTGTSILPSVEAFSRSVLFWRSLTHWIGGMGIAVMAVTIFQHFCTRRSEIINGETESPHIVNFGSEKMAIAAGIDFLKVYGILSFLCFALLVISGYAFRLVPYENWYDNLFDGLTIMFGTMGTGGFSVYNASIGLPISEGGQMVIGGLRNPTSEWIISFFMIFAGMNFSLWYVLLFKKDLKTMLKNRELQVFMTFIAFTTALISWNLTTEGLHPNVIESLRYALFNVATIISTTGFGTDDFATWPIFAQGVLFSCYLVGACVGSTGGGLKFTRFIVIFEFMKQQIKNMIFGRHDNRFSIDGVTYNEASAGLVITNVVIYFLLFLLGGVLIMMSGSQAIFTDGSVRDMDFVSAFTSSIANLGNIGPAIVNGVVGAGPTGNYSAYTMLAKVFMSALMFIGRIGVLTVIMMLFVRDEKITFDENRTHIDFDSDAPLMLR